MNSDYDDFSIAIEGIKISANAPNMNAFAERLIASARREAFNSGRPITTFQGSPPPAHS